MFTPTNQDKKAFVERTRIERQRREKERLEKETQTKQEKAARILQQWWQGHCRQRRALSECWASWDKQLDDHSLTIVECYRLVGIYCFLCRHESRQPDSKRLVAVCKCLAAKHRAPEPSSSSSTTDESGQYYMYHSLLLDNRYNERALGYLKYVLRQCLERVCAGTTMTDMYLAGPELNLLLHYLNPKTFIVKHPFDMQHTISHPAESLLLSAQSILDDCLLSFNPRDAMIRRVERVAKLEQRKARRGGSLSSDETKELRSLQLWLTTMTRICLFPLESSITENQRQSRLVYTITSVLSVPLITTTVNKMIVQHLEKLADVDAVFSLFKTKNDGDDILLDALQGNGHLFVLANLLEFIREADDSPAAVDRVVQLTNCLGSRCRQHISDRQISKYKHYHPLFKWSCSNWGNSIDVVVYERVQAQLEYLWSRSFVDLVFVDVLNFDSTKLSGRAAAAAAAGAKDGLKTRLFKKKNQAALLDSKDYAHVVELSMNVESIFAMYMLLISLFPSQRMEIINKIAFTTRLMPQLWRAMNTFGPRGRMSIYLDAARREDGNVEKEPLIKVLQMFCEAASLVFLTLDDTDIFEHETPFSTQDLIDLSTFLNTFYFALLQHAKSDQQNDAAVAAASIRAFRAAHRLLLQIYDLDMRHTFCPEGHWLLVSDPTIKQSILSLFNTSKPPAAASFLDRFRQGDPVPLRILQLMPHTIPFETRLTIFRDWIAHDRANTMRTGHCSIRVRRNHILEDGIRGLGGIPPAAWKGVIRVTFVNELGVEEAGIDHGGPFKDFVSLLVNQVFEPSFGLFATTASTNLVYPSPTSSVHGKNHIKLFEFIGKVIGKAIYEGILSDIQFASFLLAKLLGRNVFLQELRELDEDVWRNLIFLKRYDGCVEDLGLYFATDEEAFGHVTTHELKYRGKSTPVTNENKIEYVYRMADYKLNQQTREQTRAFVDGFRSIITEGWIKVFSPPELQRVISGEDMDFDIADLRQHTEYHNGYFDQHPIIRSLWQIIQEFNFEEKRAFLKFVTSCSKPPLGGFSYLYPPFTIRMVTVDPDARQGTVDGLGMVKTLFKIGNGSTNKGGRLPTASTCFNLLKLPAYTKKSLLREKLRYAINANTGFELS